MNVISFFITFYKIKKKLFCHIFCCNMFVLVALLPPIYLVFSPCYYTTSKYTEMFALYGSVCLFARLVHRYAGYGNKVLIKYTYARHRASLLRPVPPTKYLQILFACRWAFARELNEAREGKRKFTC